MLGISNYEEDWDISQDFQLKFVNYDEFGNEFILDQSGNQIYANELESYLRETTDVMIKRRMITLINTALKSKDPAAFLKDKLEKIKMSESQFGDSWR